jgi:hypothetical protein
MKGTVKLLVIAALMAASHAVLAQQSVQLSALSFVQSNGLIDLSLAGRWQAGRKIRALNTEFMTYPGTTMNVGGYSHQLRTFSNHNVPFFSRAPFVGRFFRDRSQWQNLSSGRFNVTMRPVDPAGNPSYRYAPRIQSPKLHGFIDPSPLAQP